MTWKKDILYLGGKEAAEWDATGMHITQDDHLGSPRFMTNASGTLESTQKFLPFGESIADAANAAKFAKGFTNHEQTDPSGLIYMQARFYLPWVGRFGSPDPARDQHFEQTQSWNIYSYVQNSPTMLIDPTGMFEWGAGYTGDSKEAVARRAAFVGALSASKANLAKVTDPADRALFQRAVDSYGSEGDKNGVTVAFQKSIPDASAQTTGNFGVDPKDDSKVRAEVTVTFSEKSDLEIDMPHEGSHVADHQALANSSNTTGDPASDPNNLTSRQTETKAYNVSSIAGEAAGRSKVDFPGGKVWDKSWKTKAEAKQKREAGVKSQVETYKNKDQKLYQDKK